MAEDLIGLLKKKGGNCNCKKCSGGSQKDLVSEKLRMLTQLERRLEGKAYRIVCLDSIKEGVIMSVDVKAMKEENLCPIAFEGLDIVTFMNLQEKEDMERISPNIFADCK